MTPGFLSVLLAGAAGAVGGAAIWAVKRSRPESQGLAVALGAVLFLGGNALLRKEVLSPYRARWETQQAEKELLKIRFYREMKAHEPATYQAMLRRVVAAARNNTPVALVATDNRDEIVGVLSKYLPHASDAAVLDFAQVLLEEMAAFEEKGPDLAFRFLFPRKNEVLDVSAIPKPLQERELDCIAEIIKSGATEKRPPPSEGEVDAILQRIVPLVPEEDRFHLAKASQPHAPDVDKAGLVRATRSLYLAILDLPDADAANVMRYLMKG